MLLRRGVSLRDVKLDIVPNMILIMIHSYPRNTPEYFRKLYLVMVHFGVHSANSFVKTFFFKLILNKYKLNEMPSLSFYFNQYLFTFRVFGGDKNT